MLCTDSRSRYRCERRVSILRGEERWRHVLVPILAVNIPSPVLSVALNLVDSGLPAVRVVVDASEVVEVPFQRRVLANRTGDRQDDSLPKDQKSAYLLASSRERELGPSLTVFIAVELRPCTEE